MMRIMTRYPVRADVRLDDPALESLLSGPVVVLMVGPAGGGKSTVARELTAQRPHLEIVSYDREQADGRIVGAAAVARAHGRLRQCCAGGRGAVVDGTHRQPERRAAVQRIAVAHQLPTIALVVLPSLTRCLEQQLLRSRVVPESDVRAQHAAVTELLPSLPAEGYELVAVLDPGHAVPAGFPGESGNTV
ncbi:Predicted kinase [Amycolatopsis saalfeldensis]|uniref:Predicted kinase n=2 Tax=Amycolatopsis saalfeldensis TaxID=394193 RepID=A0A1H8YNE3_9PSEU|nr:Predicted kinase [Amycolatopsis saalfeldensis]